MNITAVIPARMASSRFPGKPLTKILGLPMIEHVRRRTELIQGIDQVYVATCDLEIKNLVESCGGKVIMTKDTHRGALDRIEEAALNLKTDIVINVQGDEPMVSERTLKDVIQPFFEDEKVQSTCVAYPIKSEEELHSPNIVKAVLSKNGDFLYFSRSAIPGNKYDPKVNYFKQSGIMAFRKPMLHHFAALGPSPLEVKESVDMLRLLENGISIKAVVSEFETLGVDVQSQVEMVERAILSDPLQKSLFEKINHS